MVRVDRRARTHDQHQSVRDDVLLPGRASRQSRDDRARHPDPPVRVLVLQRIAPRASRARRDRLLVLAFRRWRLDRRVHGGLRDRTMTMSAEERGPLDRTPGVIELPAPTVWP